MIIALTGPKGSGKDTVAVLLREIVGDRVHNIAFADPIKHKICFLFDLVDTEQYDLFKRTKVSYTLPGYLSHSVDGRHLVREVGMLMRSYNPNQFTDYVRSEINKDPSLIWVITDLRFDNEYLMVREMGGLIVKINNPSVAHHDLHITERGFDDSLCDCVVNNTGSLDDLREVMKQFTTDHKLF